MPSVLQPNIFDDGNGPRLVTATAYAHPASLPFASSLPGRASTVVWYPLDTALIDAASASDTAAALRKFTAISQSVGTSAGGIGILSLRFSADVTAAIELALAQEAATAGVIAMVIAGPIGVAAAVLILGCRLIMERRRSSLRLLSARGSSTGQLRGMLGLEGVFVGLVPAALGAAIAATGGALLFGAVLGPAAFVPALLIGLAPLVILAVLAPQAAERQARADLGRRGSRTRLIVEGVVVALAGRRRRTAVPARIRGGRHRPAAGGDPAAALARGLPGDPARLPGAAARDLRPLAALVRRRPRSSGRREPCASPRSG